MAQPDPFTRIYKAIAAALRASTEWMQMVLPGNFEDLTTEIGAAKQAAVGAGGLSDYRNIGKARIDQGRCEMLSSGRNSRVYSGTQTYRVMLATDDMKVIDVNALKWATFRALVRSGDSLGLLGLVRDWKITDAADSPNPPVTPQTINALPGYTDVFSIVVEFDVPRADVITPPT